MSVSISLEVGGKKNLSCFRALSPHTELVVVKVTRSVTKRIFRLDLCLLVVTLDTRSSDYR